MMTILYHHCIDTPALAYPTITVATSKPAITFAENTINNLVPEVTGIFKPLVVPLDIVPRASIPVIEGANVTSAPGIAV